MDLQMAANMVNKGRKTDIEDLNPDLVLWLKEYETTKLLSSGFVWSEEIMYIALFIWMKKRPGERPLLSFGQNIKV